MNSTNSKRTWCALLLSCVIGSAAIAQQGSKPATKQARIGQFTINTARGTGDVSINSKSKTIATDLRGGTGKRVTITTASYDISAPRITLLQNYGRSTVETGTATGGVHIVVRQPDILTIADCDTAIYHAATGTDNPARMDLQGNVKIVHRSKQFTTEDPFVLQAKSANIKFIDADNISIHTDETEAGGTPNEPETKNGKPQ